VPMLPLGNDRWHAEFPVDTLGYYVFTIEAWVDSFATMRDGLSKKFGAGQDVETELAEIAALLAQPIGAPGDQGARVAAALSGELAARAREDRALRHAVVRYPRALPVMVERERARFG